MSQVDLRAYGKIEKPSSLGSDGYKVEIGQAVVLDGVKFADNSTDLFARYKQPYMFFVVNLRTDDKGRDFCVVQDANGELLEFSGHTCPNWYNFYDARKWIAWAGRRDELRLRRIAEMETTTAMYHSLMNEKMKNPREFES